MALRKEPEKKATSCSQEAVRLESHPTQTPPTAREDNKSRAIGLHTRAILSIMGQKQFLHQPLLWMRHVSRQKAWRAHRRKGPIPERKKVPASVTNK